MPSIHLASTESGVEKAVKRILTSRPVIGLNCKGVNMGPKGRITLVLVSTYDGEVYAFDVKDKCLLVKGGVTRLLQSPDIVKVMHDCGPEAAALHYGFSIALDNVFDTQIANAVVLESRGMPPRRVSLETLCDNYAIDRYVPSPDTQRLLKEDVNIWCRRPLTRDLLNTAARDVAALVPALYEYLSRVLVSESREWFQHLTKCNLHSLIEERRRKRKDYPRDLQPLERLVYKVENEK